jgi:hypothetical protein
MNAKPASLQVQGQNKSSRTGSGPAEEQGGPDCEYCSKNKAEIFQVTSDYCLSCWQEETHPRV